MDRAYVTKVQKALKAHGFDPGPIDGLMGVLTKSAIVNFKVAIGYRARPYIGPLTEAALFDGRVDIQDGTSSDDAPWYRIARSHLGLREYKGSRHNPQILEWWRLIRAPFSDDETPWCAGFVGGCLEECGIRSTRSAAARSYNKKNWGQVLSKDKPCVGSIAVLWRKSKTGPYGHVMFVAGRDKYGNLMGLGGNQGNAVNIKPFDTGRVLSYHYPVGFTIPETGFQSLPLVNSDGKVSRNEA